jgi:hypothetical protein
MGNLTSDMTRLCADIVSLRGARGTLMKELACEAKDLEKSVSSLCAGFTRARKDMARKTSAERAAFMSGLHTAVSQMKKEVLDDLAGARRAWQGALAVTTVEHYVHKPMTAEAKHQAKTSPVSPAAARGKDMHITAGQKKKKHRH